MAKKFQHKQYQLPCAKIDRDDFAAMMICVEREGVSRSEIVRRAIRLYVDRFTNPTLEDVKTPAA
jgi:hypothetical protein